MIEFYKMYNEVNAPKFSTQQSACFDISAFLSEKEQILSYDSQNHSFKKELQRDESKNLSFIKIKPFERVMIPTGLIFSFDCIYSLRIHSRSGLSIKKGLVLANQEGVIDCDYNQQLFVCILNLTNTEQTIYNGDRIAQGELVPNMHQLDSLSLKQIEEKPKPFGNRTGGFGSTGV
jgi:dUTP pyrophosphatase